MLVYQRVIGVTMMVFGGWDVPGSNPVCPKTTSQFWLVVDLPLWKIWVRQLGWWNSQLNGKIKHVRNHQPAIRFFPFSTNLAPGSFLDPNSMNMYLKKAAKYPPIKHGNCPLSLVVGKMATSDRSRSHTHDVYVIYTWVFDKMGGTSRNGTVCICMHLQALWGELSLAFKLGIAYVERNLYQHFPDLFPPPTSASSEWNVWQGPESEPWTALGL